MHTFFPAAAAMLASGTRWKTARLRTWRRLVGIWQMGFNNNVMSKAAYIFAWERHNYKVRAHWHKVGSFFVVALFTDTRWGHWHIEAHWGTLRHFSLTQGEIINTLRHIEALFTDTRWGHWHIEAHWGTLRHFSLTQGELTDTFLAIMLNKTSRNRIACDGMHLDIRFYHKSLNEYIGYSKLCMHTQTCWQIRIGCSWARSC